LLSPTSTLQSKLVAVEGGMIGAAGEVVASPVDLC